MGISYYLIFHFILIGDFLEDLFCVVLISIIQSMSFNILYNCEVIDQNVREMLSRYVLFYSLKCNQSINLSDLGE
jgi:hypothetical protein